MSHAFLRSCFKRSFNRLGAPLLALFMSLLAGPLWASVACTPIRWVDGDTFDFRPPHGAKVRVRLMGYDAPERGQPWSRVARDRLQAHTQAGARCECKSKDRYGRSLCHVFTVRGEPLALLMLAEGLGCIDPRFEAQERPADRALARAAQERARRMRLGLWSEPAPLCGFEYRRLRRQAVESRP